MFKVKNWCSLKCRKIHRKTPVSESLFNEVARSSTLSKIRLLHRCFLMIFAKFLRTAFFIEYLRWLLLYNSVSTCKNLKTKYQANKKNWKGNYSRNVQPFFLRFTQSCYCYFNCFSFGLVLNCNILIAKVLHES